MMSNRIERVRYYEQEYLRSADFIAEQNYHLEMRRRLNLALHLWGIVDGLDVGQCSDLPGHFFISPGMAIDAYGREIVVAQPYILSADDLRRNDKEADGPYSLWLAYKREPVTLPAAGQRVCNLKDQYTRWQESFEVIIEADDYKNPESEPRNTDSLTDDVAKEVYLVRLGKISVSGGRIKSAWFDKGDRRYIGLRAQRVLAPYDRKLPLSCSTSEIAAMSPPVFDPLSKDTSLPALEIEPNVYAPNLVLGTNFEIKPAKAKPAIPAKPSPNPNGDLKAAGNLFIQGNLYKQIGDEWLGFKELLQGLIPDVQTGETPFFNIVANANTGQLSSDTVPITVTTKLPQVSSFQFTVAIAAIEWLSLADNSTWAGIINPVPAARTAPWQLETQVQPAIINGKQYTFNVRWNIGPTANNGAGFLRANVSKLKLSYVAIFLP